LLQRWVARGRIKPETRGVRVTVCAAFKLAAIVDNVETGGFNAATSFAILSF
jgi:hypothetical protein